MVKAAIRAIEHHFPERRLTNEELAGTYDGWTAAKIEAKTGVVERRVAASDECASDLGAAAAKKLFASGACAPADVDYLLFCTQSPDYFLPATACLLQERLGIPIATGAIDVNQGCSGYVYGLGLAKGLIETGQARRVLLVTADTYTKFIHPGDKSVRTLFGDAGAATLVEGVEATDDLLGPFVYGTDGTGAMNLVVPTGGARRPPVAGAAETRDDSGNVRTVNNLYMNGPEIFGFTLRRVPEAIAALLEKSGIEVGAIDQFVFHQASRYLLEHLRRKLRLPVERFVIAMAHCGNTVSSTIPIALVEAQREGTLRRGHRVMLVGFGVGYSWGATLVRWG